MLFKDNLPRMFSINKKPAYRYYWLQVPSAWQYRMKWHIMCLYIATEFGFIYNRLLCKKKIHLYYTVHTQLVQFYSVRSVINFEYIFQHKPQKASSQSKKICWPLPLTSKRIQHQSSYFVMFLWITSYKGTLLSLKIFTPL